MKFTAKLSHSVILIIGFFFSILYDSFSEIKVTSVRACVRVYSLCTLANENKEKEKVFSRSTQFSFARVAIVLTLRTITKENKK